MTRTVRITDITPRAGKWPNVLDAIVPGVHNSQVARVVASYNDREENLAIVFANPGQVLDQAAAEGGVRAHLGALPLGIVDGSRTGAMNLRIAGSTGEELGFIISAAAAVLQRSWGWDESPSIRVDMGVRSCRFEVRHEGDRTHTAVELTAP